MINKLEYFLTHENTFMLNIIFRKKKQNKLEI